jgi:hypothetical protein
MVFTVIRIGFKPNLMLVAGSIDTGRYIQSPNSLGITDALGEKHRTFGWIFQQDGAPTHTSEAAPRWLEESIDVTWISPQIHP